MIERLAILIAALLVGTAGMPSHAADASAEASVRDDGWIRPAGDPQAEPVWGIKDGIAVGLWPARGPRGLFRVYAPYLRQTPPRMVNFIAVEPIVDGKRGQSELETGAQSGRNGLAFASGNSAEEAIAASRANKPPPPCRGRIETIDGVECLKFFVATEPFRNGAEPVLQVLLRADRPREIGFRITATAASAPLEACVLSATMGNYGRLRQLWLDDTMIDSRETWPAFQPDRLGFAPWRTWPREHLLNRDGFVIVAATSDEADPATAAYDDSVPSNWRYAGRPATHYWRTRDVEGVEVRVNGRTTYWGGRAPIPGGVSFENFELQAPYVPGQEFVFGVTERGVDSLGFTPL